MSDEEGGLVVSALETGIQDTRCELASRGFSSVKSIYPRGISDASTAMIKMKVEMDDTMTTSDN